MSGKLISAIKLILFLALGGILLTLAFRGNDLSSIITSLKGANYWWVGLSLIVSILSNISRAFRWNILIEPLGYKPRVTSTFFAIMGGYLANLALPRLGEITRCGSLSTSEKVPFEKLLGTVVAERIVDLITLLVLVAITAFVEASILGTFLHERIIYPLSSKATVLINSPKGLLLLIFILILLTATFLFMRKKAKSTGLLAKVITFIKGLGNGLLSILHLERKGAFLFHSVLIWACYLLNAYICFKCLEATSHLTMGAALFVLVAGSFGMVAPVQGGIGVFHLLISQGLLLFGISQADGLAFATIAHTSQMLLMLILGLVAFIYFSLQKSKENAKT